MANYFNGPYYPAPDDPRAYPSKESLEFLKALQQMKEEVDSWTEYKRRNAEYLFEESK